LGHKYTVEVLLLMQLDATESMAIKLSSFHGRLTAMLVASHYVLRKERFKHQFLFVAT